MQRLFEVTILIFKASKNKFKNLMLDFVNYKKETSFIFFFYFFYSNLFNTNIETGAGKITI